MTSDTFYHLGQIQATERSYVGDKAFFLNVLAQRGYPIVPGVVISGKVFRQFLETVQWSEPLFADLPGSSLHLDVNNPAQLQMVAQQIRREIDTTPLWDEWLNQLLEQVAVWDVSTVIVRPSLGLKSGSDPLLSERISGLLRSHICWAEKLALARALRKVWAELYRARSLMYWQRSGVPLQQINVAVLIQPLESAIASGDVYLTDSNAKIRSVWGLGHSLQNGYVQPDFVEVNLQTAEIQSQQTHHKTHRYKALHPSVGDAAATCLQIEQVEEAEQQQLSIHPEQSQQLAQLAQQISGELKTPVHLEWFLLHSEDVQPELWITQVNPIAEPSLRSPRPDISGGASSKLNGTLYPVSAARPNEVNDLTLAGLSASRGRVLAKALVLSSADAVPTELPPKTALVVSKITAAAAAYLRQSIGLVTDEGTLTSHGAIVARELGIPAVVGTKTATQRFQTGDMLFIDGDRGTVQRVRSTHDTERFYLNRQDGLTRRGLPSLARSETFSESHTATKLWVNLSQTETVAQVAALPVDGVGLVRSEMLLRRMFDERSPADWVAHGSEFVEGVVAQLEPILTAFNPRPVLYRTLDLRSHEMSPASPRELNPILGLHGALSYQINPALFDLELAALYQLQQAGYDNLQLMLPFVRTVEEVHFCRDRALQAGLLIDAQMQLWVMAEVPALLFLIPELAAAGVKGMSIGTNDLTQLLLAIDRDQPDLTSWIDPRHPAVLRTMEHLIRSARQVGMASSICGQAPAQYPDLVEQLVQWGINSISVSPDALSNTQQAIAQAERKVLLETIRQLEGR